jgi:prefoldin subunit 5
VSDDAFEQLEQTAKKILALIDHLQADNKRLRNQIDELENELQQIGGKPWRVQQKAELDPDRLREDALERQQLEKERG